MYGLIRVSAVQIYKEECQWKKDFDSISKGLVRCGGKFESVKDVHQEVRFSLLLQVYIYHSHVFPPVLSFLLYDSSVCPRDFCILPLHTFVSDSHCLSAQMVN